MPKKETPPDKTSLVEDLNNSPIIERLSAAIRIGTGYSRTDSIYFIGWNQGGKPIVSQDKSMLGEQAQASFKITKFYNHQALNEIIITEPTPIQFMGFGMPIDRRDKPNHLSEDIIPISIRDADNNFDQINIGELTLLQAIVEWSVNWEDVNQDTMLKTDSIPTTPMLTTFFPGEGRNIYALLFAPPLENESNENVFKQFILSAINTLITIDRKQPIEKQKGYLAAIEPGDPTPSGNPGGAFYFLSILKSIDPSTPITDNQLKQLEADSAGKGGLTQALLVLSAIGLAPKDIIEKNDNKTQDLNELSLSDLIALVKSMYQTAKKRIER